MHPLRSILALATSVYHELSNSGDGLDHVRRATECLLQFRNLLERIRQLYDGDGALNESAQSHARGLLAVIKASSDVIKQLADTLKQYQLAPGHYVANEARDRRRNVISEGYLCDIVASIERHRLKIDRRLDAIKRYARSRDSGASLLQHCIEMDGLCEMCQYLVKEARDAHRDIEINDARVSDDVPHFIESTLRAFELDSPEELPFCKLCSTMWADGRLWDEDRWNMRDGGINLRMTRVSEDMVDLEIECPNNYVSFSLAKITDFEAREMLDRSSELCTLSKFISSLFKLFSN